MTAPAPEIDNKTNADALAEDAKIAKKNGEGAAADLSAAQHNAETIVKKGTAAFGEASNSSLAAFQQLTEAYQEIARKNSARLTEAIKGLSTVRNSADFLDMQQRLAVEVFESALSDGKHIAEITVSIFTGALAPMQKRAAATHHVLSK